MAETVTPLLDARVRKVLRQAPTPFVLIAEQLPDVEPKEIREALLRLNALGKADISYGYGWHYRGEGR